MSKRARQRQDLIVALLQQPKIEKAAALAGISNTTASRIARTQEFQEEYRQARETVYAQSMARLESGADAAATTILKIMADPENKPTIRLQAAKDVLALSAKAFEREDLNVRLARIEFLQKQMELELQQTDQHRRTDTGGGRDVFKEPKVA
jgi:hypothetical protein